MKRAAHYCRDLRGILGILACTAILWSCDDPSYLVSLPIQYDVRLASDIQPDPAYSSTVDQLPRFRQLTLPEYPRLARQAGIDGQVTVSVLVSSGGSALAVSVFQTSGWSSLDKGALLAATKCTFYPARTNSRTVEARVVFTFEYFLD